MSQNIYIFFNLTKRNPYCILKYMGAGNNMFKVEFKHCINVLNIVLNRTFS